MIVRLYDVYVRGSYHYVGHTTNEQYNQLRAMGWTLICDNAPSIEEGARFAAEDHNAPLRHEEPFDDTP